MGVLLWLLLVLYFVIIVRMDIVDLLMVSRFEVILGVWIGFEEWVSWVIVLGIFGGCLIECFVLKVVMLFIWSICCFVSI